MALTLTSERRISCLFPGTPIVIQHLNGLNIVLDKAAAWAAPRKVNAADLLNMRLSPDLGGTICRRFVEALDAIDHENLLRCLHRQGLRPGRSTCSTADAAEFKPISEPPTTTGAAPSGSRQ